jgi:hypothetical protein
VAPVRLPIGVAMPSAPWLSANGATAGGWPDHVPIAYIAWSIWLIVLGVFLLI